MDLTRENLDSLFTGFDTALNEGLAQADQSHLKWCMVVPSKGALEAYPSILVTGTMREWVGPRLINDLDGKMMKVINRDFEHTERVKRNNIKDDLVGLYPPVFRAIGINANNLWPRLGTEALTDQTALWVDDKTFYISTSSGASARRLGKSGVMVNKTTNSLSEANYETARSLMMGFLGADGEPLGLVPTHLMVGPSNEKTGRQIVKASLVVSGGVAVSNVHQDEVELEVNPRLVGTAAGYWFLLCLNRGFMPVAVQQREINPLVAYDQDHDLCVKDHNENHYGLHYRGASVGFAPQLVIGNFA
jgi:phage major head subunit gpT-like protein